MAADEPHRIHPSGSFATQQVDEMVAAWRRGERPLAEEILARYPELGEDAAIRLVYEEICLRQEAGLEVDPAQIARRFPQWREELELLLQCQRLMESPAAPAEYPLAGEVLCGFRLLAELGRGAAGSVFLAVQPSLAGRPVVLKVTPRGREEHLSLARLQHMNIVPIYSEHVLQARNLQILCMPFLGGATLEKVLQSLSGKAPPERTGKELIEALDELAARLPIVPQSKGPFRQFIERASYVEAICSIGASLADGLHYAHERELLHMDVKPSNVLLAGDGQPMLLDFHLARAPVAAGGPPPPWLGGTPQYMAPEQRLAIAAVQERCPVSSAVDGRADIYSLGLVLYDTLAGDTPRAVQAVLKPLSRINPRVSVGLSDIIQKCLRPAAGDRYKSAAALANDLRRQLSDLPLRGVPNRSPLERWRKWRRRQPLGLSRILLVAALAGLIAFAAGALGVSIRQRLHDIESSLTQGRTCLDRRQFHEAASVLRAGLALAEHFPAVDHTRQALAVELARARRGEQAERLHGLAEQIRFRYGLAVPPPEEAQSILRLGRAIWDGRTALAQSVNTGGEVQFDEPTRADLIDLVASWADLRMRCAEGPEIALARQETLRVLSEAEALLGPSPALQRQRQALGEAPDLKAAPPARPLEARSASEHLDLGKLHLRSGDLKLASEQFHLGLRLRPQDFWLNFYEGLCSYRQGDFAEAVNAFRSSIVLAPETAECYYNRGLAYQALGRLDEAMADYDQACRLNKHFADAALNLGMIHYRAGRYRTARADLNRALASAPSRNMRGIIHYNLALVDWAAGDRESCAKNAQAALELGNSDVPELIRRLHHARPD
jgi:serine/threonine protein kinase/Flp pilus assembly protein TadD